MNRKIGMVIAFICLLPGPAYADVIMPLAVVTIPFLPVIVLIEALLFWLLLNRRYKVATGFWRSVVIILVANLATSALGTFLPLPYAHPQLAASFAPGGQPAVTREPAAIGAYLIIIGIAYALSVLVEWAIYLPFFRKSGPGKAALFKVSLLVNLASYIPLAVLLIIGR